MRKTMGFTLIILLLFFNSSAFSHGKQQHSKAGGTMKYGENVMWNSLNAGIQKAAIEKKPIMVDFASFDDCQRCKFMNDNLQ